MSTDTQIDSSDLGILLVSAVRYSVNGGAYAPGLVPGIVRRNIEHLEDAALTTLIRDLDYSLNAALPSEKMAFRGDEDRRGLYEKLLQILSSEWGRRHTATPITFDGGHL
jgi:hypothetical protein